MKYLFIDIDGTLTNRYGKVPLSAVQAIKWAREKGHKVFLATGRSKCEIFDYILNIGFDGIVGAAGGYVEANGSVIESNAMTKADSDIIIKILENEGIKISIETDNGVFNNGKTQEFLKYVFTSLGRDIETDLFYNMMTKVDNFDNMENVNKILYYDTNILIDDMRNRVGKNLLLFHIQ